ncbi:MAG: methionine synthase [Deltaproteobacteria bacterium]|nr:methionine synthase [Deltaproteobacteria bacterium]
MPNLKTHLKQRILVLDGAMGTALQNLNLTAQDFGGATFEGCNENLNLTRPHIIEEIHSSYLKAGCDIIETNTFGATSLVLSEYDLQEKTYDINFEAARIAKKAAHKFSTKEKPRFVAGSLGPTTKALSVTGGATFEELVDTYFLQAQALCDGGVDYLLLETCQDSRNIKAALCAIEKITRSRVKPGMTGGAIPIAISGTIEPMGTLLAGQSVEAFLSSFMHVDLLYIGLNCATGPEFMRDHIRTLSELSPFPVACVPNAGLPDEEGNYLETPRMISDVLSQFIEKKWINLVGGCCGTTPQHIEALSNLVQGKKPRSNKVKKRHFISGIEYLEITDEMRPVIVGERTNIIGSRKFKELITENKFDEASEIAKRQIKKGAHIIDICLANPDRDEFLDMKNFLEHVVKKIKAPLMIDSTDHKVMEMALTYSQGKAILNSINLEDGEERFERVTPLVKKFGAAVVVGTIDDNPTQGMGITRWRKLEIAKRSFELLTKKYGISPYDIYWDALVFPCGTGDEQFKGSALETIEGLRLIKKEFPETKTILGISNVSFGLPGQGREALNAVFLYHCVQAGLDLAIVNSEKLERYASLPKEEIKLCEALLLNQGKDPLNDFIKHYQSKKVRTREISHSLPLEKRLACYILEGSKDGLQADLDLALQTMKPLEIINGPLMQGMEEVGKLFNKNQMIVAEVLQSAEAMKAAVAHLEPHMEKSQSISQGKIILATVKGDVHDIGKNLVDIILSNNGFEVINLGIKVPPEKIIQAIREHEPHMVGLSGLLVKSAHQMVVTAEDLSKADIEIPLLVGGAALSRKFVDQKISKSYCGTAIYAADAMHGLDIAKTVMNKAAFKKLKDELHKIRKEGETLVTPKKEASQKKATPEPFRNVAIAKNIPEAPDFKKHVLHNTPVDHIFKFINPMMLYTRHLGIQGNIARLLDEDFDSKEKQGKMKAQNPKAFEIWTEVQEIKSQYKDVLKPSAVYQFFKVYGEKNKTFVFKNPTDKEPFLHFEFQRQEDKEFLCLSDYIHPQCKLHEDNLALFVTTAGKNIREEAEKLKNKGHYLKSHILQALALELAEAYAEMLHSQIRKMWGFPDPSEITMKDKFQVKYRGRRYSFGYPACPSLEDQKLLFELLKPEDIGVELTEGFMMDPEASVSALVLHHPQAKYFAV